MYRVIPLLFILLSLSIFAQSNNPISKERYNFLTDSLSIEKDKLLTEKEALLSEIDSLKNVLVKMNETWHSSRKGELVRKYGKSIGTRVIKGQVWKGMTEKMLEDSWGKPDKINKNKEKWGTFTQWYYGEITYFFKNGKMTDWEEKK